MLSVICFLILRSYKIKSLKKKVLSSCYSVRQKKKKTDVGSLTFVRWHGSGFIEKKYCIFCDTSQTAAIVNCFFFFFFFFFLNTKASIPYLMLVLLVFKRLVKFLEHFYEWIIKYSSMYHFLMMAGSCMVLRAVK